MVTIQVDDEVWRYLTMQKHPGDSFNDVLRRELGLGDDGGSDDRGDQVDIEAVLAGWEPDTEANAKVARRETVRAAEWLRESGDRQRRADFVDELLGDMHKRHYWERCVLPGLQQLSQKGLVDHRPNYNDYRWGGETTSLY